MAEYGTPAFRELWRKSGFFAALDSSAVHGKATAAEMRSMNCRHMREKLPEIRKEVARLAAALDRVNHDTLAGAAGGKVEHQHFERDVVEMGGWIASLLESYGVFYFYLSEPGYQKVNGWMQKWNEGPGPHPSRLP